MKMLVQNKILVRIRLTKLDAFCPLKITQFCRVINKFKRICDRFENVK